MKALLKIEGFEEGGMGFWSRSFGWLIEGR